jgi:hypothetical protein
MTEPKVRRKACKRPGSPDSRIPVRRLPWEKGDGEEIMIYAQNETDVLREYEERTS